MLNSLTFISCNKESDITVLHNRIDELADIVEDHKENKLSDYLAKDFVTGENLNQSQFLLFSRYHLKRNKKISIIIVDRNVIVNNDVFDVKFRVLLVGSNSLFPERGQTYTIYSRWNKEEGTWMMSRLRWESFKTNE